MRIGSRHARKSSGRVFSSFIANSEISSLFSEDAESDLEVLPQPAPATAGPAVLVLSTSTLPDMFVDASAHGIGLVFDNMWVLVLDSKR